ncbi:MAG: hypothetical protein EOO03_11175 [Chitinophagaceae bacterium]|nr:MAG: hypothetical protein EOO03_11175 [Chitinophagaceae bacterium]
MAPEAKLYLAIVERIQKEAPEVRYIEQDLGQLENYQIRPAVSWPCALIDLDEIDFSDAGNDLVQIGQGFVQIRVGLVKYTDSNNLTPKNIRPNALRYMEQAEKLANALHGWAPEGFGRLLLRKSVTEKRDDDIRAKVLRFEISFKVNRTPAKATVPRPSGIIGSGTPN